jgi:hypothetical protein
LESRSRGRKRRLSWCTKNRKSQARETPAGNYGGIQDDNRIEKAGEPTGKPGRPEHAQGGKKYGKSRVAGKPPGKSRSDDAGEKRFGGNPGKIILCHKNRVTISVGAPAEPAHLRHGDSLGAC